MPANHAYADLHRRLFNTVLLSTFIAKVLW